MAATWSGPRRPSSTTRTASMVAPFPPNQRCRRSQSGKAPRSSASIVTSSEVIVEALLRAAEAEHGPQRRRLFGRQPDQCRRSLPESALAGEDVVYLVGL